MDCRDGLWVGFGDCGVLVICVFWVLAGVSDSFTFVVVALRWVLVICVFWVDLVQAGVVATLWDVILSFLRVSVLCGVGVIQVSSVLSVFGCL